MFTATTDIYTIFNCIQYRGSSVSAISYTIKIGNIKGDFRYAVSEYLFKRPCSDQGL